MARHFLTLLPPRAGDPLPERRDQPAAARRTLDRLMSIISPQANKAYDMREVLQELVDSQSLFELQPDYGRSMITALARIGGVPCMLIANQPSTQAGAITRECAEKAVQRDPNYADGWVAVGNMSLDEFRFGLNPLPGSLDRALKAARRAVELDPDNGLARALLANVHFRSHGEG